MSDSEVVSRLRTIQSEQMKPTEPDESDDCGAFGWLRGPRERAMMLEIRERSGEISLFSYAFLHPVFYDPSGQLILQFGVQKVVIQGENLKQEVQPNVTLLGCLGRHRVTWIAESESSLILTGTKLITIESISIVN